VQTCPPRRAWRQWCPKIQHAIRFTRLTHGLDQSAQHLTPAFWCGSDAIGAILWPIAYRSLSSQQAVLKVAMRPSKMPSDHAAKRPGPLTGAVGRLRNPFRSLSYSTSGRPLSKNAQNLGRWFREGSGDGHERAIGRISLCAAESASDGDRGKGVVAQQAGCDRRVCSQQDRETTAAAIGEGSYRSRDQEAAINIANRGSLGFMSAGAAPSHRCRRTWACRRRCPCPRWRGISFARNAAPGTARP
jgi:hypothetical protein